MCIHNVPFPLFFFFPPLWKLHIEEIIKVNRRELWKRETQFFFFNTVVFLEAHEI